MEDEGLDLEDLQDQLDSAKDRPLPVPQPSKPVTPDFEIEDRPSMMDPPPVPPPAQGQQATLKSLADLQSEEKAADEKKNLYSAIGSAADSLGNRPTYASLMLGRNPAQSNMGETLPQSVVDPTERYKKLLDTYKAVQDQRDDQTMRDPTSIGSQITRANAGSMIEALKGAAANNPKLAHSYSEIQSLIADPSTTAHDLQAAIDKNPMMKEQFSALIAERKSNAQQALWQGRFQREDARTGAMNAAREDRLSNQTAGIVNKDPIILQATKQSNAIDRGLHTLAGGQITPQIFNEIQDDFANAINTGGSHAASEQDQLKFHSLQMDLTNLKQRLTGNPQEYNNPQVMAMLTNLGQRLKSSYQGNIAERTQQLLGARKFSTKSAQDTADSLLQQGESQRPAASMGPTTMVSPQENQQALQWALANKGNPKAIEILMNLSKSSTAR